MLKTEHDGKCPATGDYTAAEAQAKQDMGVGTAKNFEIKVWIRHLVSKGRAGHLKITAAARKTLQEQGLLVDSIAVYDSDA